MSDASRLVGNARPDPMAPYERRLDILTGFHLLAASLICFKFVR
jgi:hypothetical protein